MKFINVLVIIFFFGEATIGHASEADGCDLEPPVDLSSFSDVVPQCLGQRTRSTDGASMLEIDGRFCECARSSAMLRIQPAAVQPSSIVDRVRTSQTNNIALEILSESSNENHAERRLLTQTGQEFRQTQREGVSPQISSYISSANTIPDSQRDSQCVTFTEYTSQRSIPAENSFFTGLQSLTSFDSNDWSLPKLADKYDTADAGTRQQILARMTFLNRNPLIHNLFAGGFSISPETSAQRIELFQLLKTLVPPAGSTCTQRVNACWEELNKSNRFKDFRDKLSAFMARPDVTDSVSAATNFQMNLIRGGLGSTFHTPQTYYNILTARNETPVTSCFGSQARASCYDSLRSHCEIIKELQDSPQESLSEGQMMMRGLKADAFENGFLDPDSNLSFKAFNETICNERYTSADGSRQMNFFEFRNQSCSGSGSASAPADCGDRRALLSRFMREFPSGGGEETERLRSGLSGAASRVQIAQIRAEVLTAANSVNVKPKDLRSQFDGQIPVVSQQGTLVSSASSSANAPIAKTVSGSTAARLDDQASSATTGLMREIQGLREEIQNRNNLRNRPVDSNRSFQETSSAELSEATENSHQNFKNTNLNPRRDYQESQQIVPRSNGIVDQTIPASPAQAGAPIPQATVPSTSALFPRGGAGQPTLSSPAPSYGRNTPQPIAEVSPRRGSGGGISSVASRSPASVDEPSAPSSFDFRPVIPVTVNEQKLAAALSDPQSLASDKDVMEKVNSSSDSVVRLGLRLAGSNEDTVVYAIKEDGNVRFSLVNPSDRPVTRPVLNANEMNVRVPDQTMFTRIQSNPSSLREYGDIVRAAAELPGQVVRMNVISAEGSTLTVYLDKRRSVPTFSLIEPRSR